jgi:hypothetical protein
LGPVADKGEITRLGAAVNSGIILINCKNDNISMRYGGQMVRPRQLFNNQGNAGFTGLKFKYLVSGSAMLSPAIFSPHDSQRHFRLRGGE